MHAKSVITLDNRVRIFVKTGKTFLRGPGVCPGNPESPQCREERLMSCMLASQQTVRKFWIWGLVLCFSVPVLPAGSQPKAPGAQKAKQAVVRKAGTTKLVAGADTGTVVARSDIAGVVLEIKGKWNISSGTKVKEINRGDGVPDGWSLKALEKDASIKVLLSDGTTLSCPGGSGCQFPISVSKNQSPANSWLTAAIGMFVQKPDQWVVLQSRAADLKTRDSVLKAGKTIDLSPVCREMDHEGSYYVRIRSAGDSAGRELGPEPIAFTRESPVIVSAPHLTPGLYIINILNNKDEEPSVYNQAWVLIADAQSYDRQLGSYLKAVEASSALKRDVPENKVRELLRAYMASLNERIR
jgi:hypothetical protein